MDENSQISLFLAGLVLLAGLGVNEGSPADTSAIGTKPATVEWVSPDQKTAVFKKENGYRLYVALPQYHGTVKIGERYIAWWKPVTRWGGAIVFKKV